MRDDVGFGHDAQSSAEDEECCDGEEELWGDPVPGQGCDIHDHGEACNGEDDPGAKRVLEPVGKHGAEEPRDLGRLCSCMLPMDTRGEGRAVG